MLWASFGLVLLIAGIGLAALSRHALRLSRQQAEIRVSEKTEQDIRVALWRIDSRLAPYLATLNFDTDGRVDEDGGGEEQPNDYVRERFRVNGFGFSRDQGAGYSYLQDDAKLAKRMMKGGGRDRDPESKTLPEAIPVDDFVAAVQRLNPDFETPITNSLVQSYSVAPQQMPAVQQRELYNRSAAVQQQLQANYPQQAALPAVSDELQAARTAVKLIPTWIEEELVVARFSVQGTMQVLEGAWIDWPALSASLLGEVDDLLPEATLRPVRDPDEVDPSRALAALPAMIVPGEFALEPASWSPTHTALLLAWLAFIAAALLAALALGGAIGLSQRQGAFVSAVTHELRTPLTTFRLYSDLLAREMVSDPADRQEYYQTLRREADRLTHLVDNVLRYSRLERGGKRPELEPVIVGQWIERITPRLSKRLANEAMELVVETSGDGQWMTDPAAMEQVVFNLVDNAGKYATESQDRRVHLISRVEEKLVCIDVRDHGPGVPSSLRSTMFQPFSKSAERAAETAAGVGLGLALASQVVGTLGGKLSYQHGEEGGAVFSLRMPRQ